RDHQEFLGAPHPPLPPQMSPPPGTGIRPSTPSRSRSTMWKWLLGGVVLVAVVGLTVVVTISVIDGNHGKPPNSTPPGQGSLTSEFASAADDGPVTIITEEPTCEPMA